jgi:hypothetical protein
MGPGLSKVTGARASLTLLAAKPSILSFATYLDAFAYWEWEDAAKKCPGYFIILINIMKNLAVTSVA